MYLLGAILLGSKEVGDVVCHPSQRMSFIIAPEGHLLQVECSELFLPMVFDALGELVDSLKEFGKTCYTFIYPFLRMRMGK